MLQNEAQLTAFYDSVLAELCGAMPLASLKSTCAPSCIEDPLFWRICEVYAGNSLSCGAALTAARQLWGNATGIGLKNLQALGKMTHASVQYTCSRICAGAVALAQAGSADAANESAVALKLACKFMDGHFKRLWPEGAWSCPVPCRLTRRQAGWAPRTCCTTSTRHLRRCSWSISAPCAAPLKSVRRTQIHCE